MSLRRLSAPSLPFCLGALMAAGSPSHPVQLCRCSASLPPRHSAPRESILGGCTRAPCKPNLEAAQRCGSRTGWSLRSHPILQLVALELTIHGARAGCSMFNRASPMLTCELRTISWIALKIIASQRPLLFEHCLGPFKRNTAKRGR